MLVVQLTVSEFRSSLKLRTRSVNLTHGKDRGTVAVGCATGVYANIDGKHDDDKFGINPVVATLIPTFCARATACRGKNITDNKF